MKFKKFISAVIALAVSIMCLAGLGGCKNKEVWKARRDGPGVKYLPNKCEIRSEERRVGKEC